MKTAIKTYHRPDGVVGCGFYGEFGGLWQHSISWPDQSATRMRFEDLEDRQIKVKDLAVVPFGGRDLIDMSSQSGEGYSTAVDDIPGSVDLESGEVTQAEVTPVDPPALEDAIPFDPSKSESANIRIALEMMPGETNKAIIETLNSYGVDVSSAQVTRERKAIAKAELSE